MCNGGVNDVYNNNWKKIISQIMMFFQYNDNANLKMLDILHRYDLSDNSYVNKEIKKINSKLKKTAKLFNHFTIVLLCYTKYWFLNNQ